MIKQGLKWADLEIARRRSPDQRLREFTFKEPSPLPPGITASREILAVSLPDPKDHVSLAILDSGELLLLDPER